MTWRSDGLQIRGARAMLGWSMTDLATASDVSVSTVKRIEDGRYGLVADHTWLLVQRALETAGVTFLAEDEDGIGVRIRRGRNAMHPDRWTVGERPA